MAIYFMFEQPFPLFRTEYFNVILNSSSLENSQELIIKHTGRACTLFLKRKQQSLNYPQPHT